MEQNAPLTMSDLVGDDAGLEEFGVMPTEKKLEATLANPQLPGAMKLGAVHAITKARMRNQVATLFSQEMPNIRAALAELREANPKVYIDQILAIAEFAIPKLKAVEVTGESEAGRKANEMSLDELMGAISDDRVVSVQ